MRIIKRYSNRKLYDTVGKSYITLENVENLIKEGEGVQIIDNDSGDDITASTLSQIIAERTRKSQIYSPTVFVDLIRKGGGTMYDYGRKMLQSLGDTVYCLEEEVEKKVKSLVSSGELTEAEGKQLAQEAHRQRGAYLQRIEQQMESLTQNLLTKLSIPAKEDMKQLQKTVQKLEQTIQALEQKIENANSQKPEEENH